MSQQKQPSVSEQAEMRLQEEALRVAKSTQTPGQTKEQTKLIAKGIEKGIAFYKQQQKAKARELDKARKKALKQRPLVESGQEEPTQAYEPESEYSASRPALRVAGTIFCLAALLQGLRYWLGWPVLVGSFEIPLPWSLAAAFVAAALGLWMFRAGRD